MLKSMFTRLWRVEIFGNRFSIVGYLDFDLDFRHHQNGHVNDGVDLEVRDIHDHIGDL